MVGPSNNSSWYSKNRSGKFLKKLLIVLLQWGVLHNGLVLPPKLISWSGHHKEIIADVSCISPSSVLILCGVWLSRWWKFLYFRQQEFFSQIPWPAQSDVLHLQAVQETKKCALLTNFTSLQIIIIVFRSISASGQLPTYPSPNPTLTLTCCQLTVVELGEG